MKSSILKRSIDYLAELPLWPRNKTFLITGASGMLGAYLALAALESGSGNRVVLTCRNKGKAKDLFGKHGAEIIYQDIREPLKYDGNIDYILHTAAAVGPSEFAAHPGDVISIAVTGTLSLLDLAVKRGCEGFVLASTLEVYGNAEGGVDEASPLLPLDTMNSRSCYPEGKRAAETAVCCYSAQYGLRGMAARLSRIYGPLMNLNSGLFICDFLLDMLDGRDVRIKGDANLLRPLVYIQDAAEAMLCILFHGETQNTYNVQGRELPTILDAAESVARMGGVGVTLDKPSSRDMPESGYWLKTEKLEALGWKQTVSLEDGLRNTAEFLKGTEDNAL